jgi:hypothetical protein
MQVHRGRLGVLKPRHADEVGRRRRLLTRLGFAALGIATTAACIFDDGGDYQGGGRRETIVTATPTTIATEEPDAPDATGPGTGLLDGATFDN